MGVTYRLLSLLLPRALCPMRCVGDRARSALLFSFVMSTSVAVALCPLLTHRVCLLYILLSTLSSNLDNTSITRTPDNRYTRTVPTVTVCSCAQTELIEATAGGSGSHLIGRANSICDAPGMTAPRVQERRKSTCGNTSTPTRIPSSTHTEPLTILAYWRSTHTLLLDVTSYRD